MNIYFPSYDHAYGPKGGKPVEQQFHRYYSTHHKYVLNILMRSDNSIRPQPPQKFQINKKLFFETTMGGKRVGFDISDHENLSITEEQLKSFHAVFKFHYARMHYDIPNIHSFSPINFYSWNQFDDLAKHINYAPNAKKKILNNQTARAAAKERRTIVSQMLSEKYGSEVDFSITDQIEYWKKINGSLVSICVPGARNDMLDRGQGQYMFFGACTISPRLVTRLSWDKEIIPNEHYVECKPDYSDLIDKIEWCRNNLGECKRIGDNAKSLMMSTSTPSKQIEWINKNI
jgi:hypothetical protein